MWVPFIGMMIGLALGVAYYLYLLWQDRKDRAFIRELSTMKRNLDELAEPKKQKPANDEYTAWVDKDGGWHAPCRRADIPPGQELKKGWLSRW